MATKTLTEFMALIPPPNNMAENFMAWLNAAMTVDINTQDCLEEIVVAFGIDTAVGPQLDVIGDLLALPRTVDFDPGGGFSPTLNDYYYRTILKAQILKNIWKGTKGEIYDFWAKYFPESPVLIQDNQNMTMTVIVVNPPTEAEQGTVTFGYDSNTATVQGYNLGYWEGFSNLIQGLITNGYYTPKPAGVLVDYIFITQPVFAYDADSALLKGYNDAEWLGPLS